VTAYFKVIDITSPEIYDIHIVKYSDTTATIAWKASEKTSGYVKYKRGDTGEYMDSVPSTFDAEDNHVVKLTGLKPNGIYYYVIELKDTSGNTATSKTQALSTRPLIKEGHDEGKRAPNLVLTPYENYSELPLTNGTLELTEFLGKKKLYINFWSTYCAPCIVEFPVIETIYADVIDPQEWEMITICIDGRDDRIVKLKEKYPELKLITLPTLFYAEGTDQNVYHIWKVPTSVFIDEDGIIRYVKLGRFYNTQELKDALDSIL
jgi:thiol-disulfide isomerase/thioredoxin